MNERYTYVLIREDEELHIRELLKRRLHFSSRLLRQLKKQECVFLNGKPVWLKDKGKGGDQLTVIMPEESSHFDPEPIPIDVIYEDEDLLVVNKQPGLVVHPTKGHVCHTLANGIMNYMLEKGDSYKIRFINRLDMDTSGVLLVGKNSHAQDNLSGQMSGGRTEKRYLAVLKGLLEGEEGIVDLPIGKPVDDQVHRAVKEDGYPSVTKYRILQRFPRGYTLVKLLLETGRTHQIRVHMAHIGHPVVGDALYGSEAVWLIERQALHAASFSCDHPATGKRLTFQAPLPEDMEKLIRKLKQE